MIKYILTTTLLLGCCQVAGADPLAAWNDTLPKKAITDWVERSVKPGSPDFIPEKSRYVVFDNDGTLWPEAPLTFQLRFVEDEIRRMAPEHPKWKNDPLISAVLNGDAETVKKSGEEGLFKLLSLTHTGLTTEEFSNNVTRWLDTHQNKRFGCRYDQLGYMPMRQLLDYLRANGFKTWIVSGAGIDFIRVMSQRMYGIPPEQVVGSFSLSDFTVTDTDTHLRKTTKGMFYNDATHKPVAIHLFMGHHPVAAFGNSDGDLAMMQYTADNPHFRAFGMLLHHTDAAREYAYDSHPHSSGRLVMGLAQAKSKGWSVVDMKQDWKTVFDPQQCRTQ